MLTHAHDAGTTRHFSTDSTPESLRAQLFQREMDSMKDRDRLLHEKLREAVKRAKDMKDEKPIRPIDLE